MEFRVYDNVAKRYMRSPCYMNQDWVTYRDCDPNGIDMSGVRKVYPNNLVFELVSGKHDSKGVVICEGDIIHSTFGNGTPCVVLFGEFRDNDDLASAIGLYILEDDGDTRPLVDTIQGNTSAYTVIGNVHDENFEEKYKQLNLS